MDQQASWFTKRRLTRIAAVATIGLVSFAGGCVVAAPPQPHMYNALTALQNARTELQVAEAH
jgi:hypothetical protein